MSGTRADAYLYFKRDGFIMKVQYPITIVESEISFYSLSFEMCNFVDKVLGVFVKQYAVYGNEVYP